MSAIVPKNGPIRQLDKPAEPDENVTEDEVKDAPRLARRIMGALRDIASLKRRWWPRRVDHEDVPVGNTGNADPIRFPHGFDGRVRWWVVDWSPAVTGNTYILERADGTGLTDSNTLVLYSSEEGVLTLRIEEVG